MAFLCSSQLSLLAILHFPSYTTLWKEKDELSNYARALDLLKSNIPEERIDVHLSYSMYLELQKTWSKFKDEMGIRENQRYPRLSYNSLEQVATVITMRRALHQVAASNFNAQINANVDEYLSNHWPHGRDRFLLTGSTTQRGQSKYYRKLLCDKDLWMQGMDATAVVLICIKESPTFKNPHTAFKEDIEDVDVDVQKMKQHVDKVWQKNREKGFYGPVEYRNHRWFGKLREVVIEVWRVGRNDPVRTWLIKDGLACESQRTTVGLRISDFLGSREFLAATIPDVDVHFDIDRYVAALMRAIKITAKGRYIDFVRG
ncbi:hypothetical protein V1509DRAFT_659350 [Lipomyces kononenkoae]